MSETVKGRSWRDAPGWMKAVMVVSLLANASVVGVAVGSVMRFEGRWGGESGLDRRQERILQLVPESRRDAARQVLMSRRDEADAARANLLVAQQHVYDALRHDPFDPAALSAALADRRQAASKMWSIGYDQIADIAAMLTPEERGVLADRMEERTKRWLERKKGSSD